MQAVKTCVASAVRQAQRRTYATATTPYSSTINNLRIHNDTRVIYQGFTGHQGTFHAQQAIEYGKFLLGALVLTQLLIENRNQCRWRHEPQESWLYSPR